MRSIQEFDQFGLDANSGEIYIPSQPFANQDEDILNRLVTATNSPSVTTSSGSAVSGGPPFQVFNLSATESPSKQQDRTFSLVSVSFNRYSNDDSFAAVRIWFTGYKGNPNPVLVADGQDSPISFLCETTGETVVAAAQAVGVDGTPADLDSSPTTTVVLDGVVSAPPAPTVTQQLVSLPLGFQFTFSILAGLASDVISSYRIYRNTVNNSGSATLFDTRPQPPNNIGQIVYQDFTPGANSTQYYWVSAVNTMGLESTLTAAQSTATTSAPIGTGQAANNLAGYTPTTQPLSQHLTTTQIDIASFQIQFPTGLVTYNSGSVDPGGYGLYLIYCDDPARAGGAVSYHFTQNSQDITAVDGRLYLGKITTAGGGGGTGDGGGAGACFSGNVRILTTHGYVSFQSLPKDRLFSIVNRTGTHPATLIVHPNWHEEMIDMGDGELVTFGHHIKVWESKPFAPAIQVLPKDPTTDYTGTVYNLSILTDDEDSRHFVLENGIIAHNLRKF